MKAIIFYISFFLVLACSCDEDDGQSPLPAQTWSYAGLGQDTILEVEIIEEQLWAATRNGMYKKSVNASDTSWIHAGLAGQTITDFIAFSVQEILAAIALGPANPNQPFYKTEDGGTTWEPMQSNFGGPDVQTCYALAMHPEQPDILYARGNYNVAKSTDRGQTWVSVFGDWDSFGYQADLIYIDPNHTDVVWAGGESGIFSPYLYKSMDAGQTWTPMNIPYQGDNAVYSIVTDPADSNRVLVGMEGQIIATEDGMNWDILFSPENYSYIKDIQLSTVNQNKLYAVGTDGGNNIGDIIVYVSDDFGNSWEANRHEGPKGKVYAAEDLALYQYQGQELIYVGTNQGVFIYKP